MRLPNGERAVVPIEKLRDYALNPAHSEGRHKATVFRAVLNFTQADATRLSEMILEAARTGEATEGKLCRRVRCMDSTFLYNRRVVKS